MPQLQNNGIAWQFLYKIPEESQKELLETFYAWTVDENYAMFDYSPNNTKTIKYIWVDDHNITLGESHMTVHIYVKYTKECSGIDMWEEGLI